MAKEKLTEEEHKARATLLGMLYHHGNGEPFYWKIEDGKFELVDPDTLQPIEPKYMSRERWLT